MSKLGKLFGVDETVLKQKFRGDELEKINELLDIAEGNDLEAKP